MRQLKIWTANTRAQKNENTSSNKSLLLLLFSPNQAKVVPPVNNSVNSKASLVTNGNCKLEKERRNQSPARRPIFSARWTERASGRRRRHWAKWQQIGRLWIYTFGRWTLQCLDWTGLAWSLTMQQQREREKKVKSKRKDTNRTLTTLCLPQTSNHRGERRKSRDMPSAEIERFQHASIIITINGT